MAVLDHLTDEALTADLDANPMWRGVIRRAEILLDVPAEDRLEIVSMAHRRTNMTGGRYCDNLSMEREAFRSGARLQPLV